MNYTPQQFKEIEFNRRMSELDCHPAVNDVTMPWPDYYNDLNQLMPLAWKYKLDVYLEDTKDGTVPEWWCSSFYGSTKVRKMHPIQAIRDCLWTIWQEGNTNE